MYESKYLLSISYVLSQIFCCYFKFFKDASLSTCYAPRQSELQFPRFVIVRRVLVLFDRAALSHYSECKSRRETDRPLESALVCDRSDKRERERERMRVSRASFSTLIKVTELLISLIKREVTPRDDDDDERSLREPLQNSMLEYEIYETRNFQVGIRMQTRRERIRRFLLLRPAAAGETIHLIAAYKLNNPLDPRSTSCECSPQ